MCDEHCVSSLALSISKIQSIEDIFTKDYGPDSGNDKAVHTTGPATLGLHAFIFEQGKKEKKLNNLLQFFLVILTEIYISIDFFVIYPLGQFRVPKTYICVHVLLTE